MAVRIVVAAARGRGVHRAMLLRLGLVGWRRLVGRGGLVRGGFVSTSASLVLGLVRVDSLSLVLDLSHIATFVGGCVGDSLDSTVRKGNTVGALQVAGLVLDLLLVKVGAGVGVAHSVLVVEGGRITAMLFVARPLVVVARPVLSLVEGGLVAEGRGGKGG